MERTRGFFPGSVIAIGSNAYAALSMPSLTASFAAYCSVSTTLILLCPLNEPSTSSTTRDAVALQLAPLMKPLRADAGFLFDVDPARVALAAEDGTPVSEEMVLPLLADYLLPRAPGKLIIANISSTALLEEIAARHGGKVVRVPVGRQAAIDALSTYRPEQIALAGEGTGAV